MLASTVQTGPATGLSTEDRIDLAPDEQRTASSIGKLSSSAKTG